MTKPNGYLGFVSFMKFKEIKLSSVGRKTDTAIAVKTIQLATNCALKLYVAARSGLSPVPESGDGVNGGEGAKCLGLVFDQPYDAGEAKEGA
ncbi:hypothetical protein [Brucella lupini]|uniref:hypothetical protein n=1 Tax=Brucella lupini TaxID=255457 RepID=UPI00142DECFC|nr:hypothetical protein [Brucella lupini]